jgi:hypothetical protein
MLEPKLAVVINNKAGAYLDSEDARALHSIPTSLGGHIIDILVISSQDWWFNLLTPDLFVGFRFNPDPSSQSN